MADKFHASHLTESVPGDLIFMQQRRLRLGDILDDYCPRERRITNHAVVAMIDDTVKQTRCTTCDAEHEYKEARVPAARRRKTATPAAHLVEAPSQAAADVADVQDFPDESPSMVDDVPDLTETAETIQLEAETQGQLDDAPASEPMGEGEQTDETDRDHDEWPVHRPLIRATLPRPEGQAPERKAPDFTFRPSGGRFDSRNGQRNRGGHRPQRNAHGHSQSGPSQSRFGGQRGPGHGGGPHGQRHGNRSGQGGGSGRPGQGRGPRPGGGRKRGR
jgi:hypothetical protein